jgi:hypothetical protein
MWTCSKCGEKIEDQFNSCWKCAGPPNKIGLASTRQRQGLGWSFFAFAILLSFLAPLLADSLHSFFVVSSGIRFYNAELGRILLWRFWVAVAVRGLMTLPVVWLFARIGFKDIWVWCCLVLFWLLVDFELEIAIR